MVRWLSLTGLGMSQASEEINTGQGEEQIGLISTNSENKGDSDRHQIHAELNGKKGLQTGECGSLLTCSRLGEEQQQTG